MDNPLLTAALTILGGIVVFVGGQLISRFIIEPVQAQRAAIGGVVHTLVLFQDIYSNPGVARNDLNVEAARAIRQVASDLMAKTFAVPSCPLLEWFGLLPSELFAA